MVWQEQSEVALQFKRKQIVIAVFLLLFVLVTAGFLFYFAYDLMRGGAGENITTGGVKPIKMPVFNSSQVLAQKQPVDNRDYFIYGEFSSQDKKYRLYKVRYKESAKEIIFSLPWSDANSLPGSAVYKNYIAVFPSVDNGFFIDHDGHPANTGEFIPPSRYFTVSPDGNKIFYFKYFSSLGNTMLVLRDLRNSQDLHSWPLNSPASKVCDFAGWSADGVSAYCLRADGNAVKLISFDSKKYLYSIIASMSDVTNARYYPNHALLVAVVKNNIVVYSVNTKETKNIVVAPDGAEIKNVFLAGTGSKIFYAVAGRVYSINIDGSGRKELPTVKNYDLISISTGTSDMLLENIDENNNSARRYFISNSEGQDISELYISDTEISGSQLIGWFADDIVK